MKSITNKKLKEKYQVREKAVLYARKYGYAAASRKYLFLRQSIHVWDKKYDGTLESLYPKSTRPKSHPNQHTEEELELIKKMYSRFKKKGLAHVFMKLMCVGYTRSFTSFKTQIRKLKLKEKTKVNNPIKKDTYEKLKGTYPGEHVQIDVKYVPQGCIGFKTLGKRFYQITAIDLFSRNRVLEIIDEHSSYGLAKFTLNLEKRFGFKINIIQTDNGSEFVNNAVNSAKKSAFQKVLKQLGIKHKTTRPYSPWQNGVVERSHREDGERFFNQIFKSEEELRRKHKRYNSVYNNTAKQVLNFKTPNQIIKEYNEKVMNIVS